MANNVPLPIVAIVGRPNVGKSTLFNKLIGEQLAIVEDVPGTTRDRLYGFTDWNGREFTVIDTGGIDLSPETNIGAQVRAHAEQAIEEADALIMVVDAREGMTPQDLEVAEILRRTSKPVFLAANKAESAERRMNAVEFYELGIGEPIPLTAYHGTGIAELLDELVPQLPPGPVLQRQDEEEMLELEAETEQENPEDNPNEIGVAIIGRPNVGKSSLVNALLGRERTIVSDIPGTTRDAIDTVIAYRDREITLIDTAGIRRRGKVVPGVEKYSVMRALRAVSRADIVLLIIDASEGVTEQDAHVAGYIQDAYKGAIIVVNKWDLIERKADTMELYRQEVLAKMKFLDYAPMVFVSAKTRLRVDRILDEVLKVNEERYKRIATAQLNDVVERMVDAHQPPPGERGKRLKIFYATQPRVNPPTFVFFVNDPKLVHWSYKRYMENRLREAFGYTGTPLRLSFRIRGT